MIDNSTFAQSENKVTKEDLENLSSSSTLYRYASDGLYGEDDVCSTVFLSHGCYSLARKRCDVELLFYHIQGFLFFGSQVRPYLQRLVPLVWQFSLTDNPLGYRITCRASDETSIVFSRVWEDSYFHDFVEVPQIVIWAFPHPKPRNLIRWVLKLDSER